MFLLQPDQLLYATATIEPRDNEENYGSPILIVSIVVAFLVYSNLYIKNPKK